MERSQAQTPGRDGVFPGKTAVHTLSTVAQPALEVLGHRERKQIFFPSAIYHSACTWDDAAFSPPDIALSTTSFCSNTSS